ncbi:hypothetical protein [Ponticaulis profundi]|uniref:Uncharacterized protein n=1 Tax=Ponticaulis profundi TaxID=2665222 RepID=A0ABW1S9G1_9PROT|tara:strand:+ start:209 stop:493 length:285 start_codon:yes stop_codon:yes gene_type:complete
MFEFSSSDIDEIDALWRQCSTDHPWAGWAKPGGRNDEVWIFRRRNNWRRFSLIRTRLTYRLLDEKGRVVAVARRLSDLLDRVEGIPGIHESVDW